MRKLLVLALVATFLGTAPAARAQAVSDRDVLLQYAADTWKSMEALVAPETGLPASVISGDLKERKGWTGPTPFGSYLWSATAAWRSGLIKRPEARQKVERMLDSLAKLDYHQPSGMFYRWYSPQTGKLLTTWPEDGKPVYPFLSSVDNAWAAAGLMVVKNAFPELRKQVAPLLDRMRFDTFYVPDAKGANPGGGLMRAGAYDEQPAAGTCTEQKDGVWYTCGFYGAPGETRMATYVGMALGQVPAQAYFGQNRGFVDSNCGQEQKPTGFYRDYLGVKVWEGAYAYRGMKITPNWNGSMFEAMMPNLLVPEEKWGKRSWAINHPNWVRAQIEHGLDEARYGYWGFSPANNPAGGYREYGVDAIGMNPGGATSDQERTTIDYGFDGCRPAKPAPTGYGDGVVTPHASFLALRYAPREALDNLAKLKQNFPVYGEGGFLDAVAVKSGKVANEYLSLDQGMVMAALGNALSDDSLRDYFSFGETTARLAPVIAMEEFAAEPRPSDWTIRSYAADTWKSMEAMVEPATGLPADNIGADLSAASRSATTSPTNIGMYLWGAVTARDVGLITATQAAQKVGKVLDTLAAMDKHEPSGMFYNWVDPKTGKPLTIWPGGGNEVFPFLSSVDNGWLASALMVVRNAVPEARDRAQALLSAMNWRYFYNPAARPGLPVGLMRGGFWPVKPTDGRCTTSSPDFPDVTMSCGNYGALGETRIATYVGIAMGQVPREMYFGMYRTFAENDCGQETKPQGTTVNHLGVAVFEGTYDYRGLRLVPNWGGSMFEALMNDLVVPENEWAPKSWGRNHPVFVRAQIEHGINEAKYGYWGFSPSNNPAGGYREYGVDGISINAGGYTSDQERTTTDQGFPGCRDPKPAPTFGDGVVTPHASALAYRYAPSETLDNLAKLRQNFDAYGPGGFYDAVAVMSGAVSKRYLALDQGMLLASFGNALTGDKLRGYFAEGEAEAVLKPLLAIEEWDARS